ncbi:MAG: HAMP domain-containing histidine kinase [Bacteroidales bacterium]|nr:HAMP domain-containing histidine kinase [Bacteroidales bacterium]
MKPFLFDRHSVPIVVFGVLVAIVCLGSTWYINRLQADLARAVRRDAAGTEAAVDLQVQLRHLRVHTLVLVAEPTDDRWAVVRADMARVDTAIQELQHVVRGSPEEIQLVKVIQRDYADYRQQLDLKHLPKQNGTMADVAKWSDSHHMSDLLAPCRELADRHQRRMNEGLAEAEAQSVWAGRLLLGLGSLGVLAGLLSGYATARGLSQRVAQLSVRVRAVQAQLDQDIGEMTVERAGSLADLDEQLHHVVAQVKEVCQRLQEQERDLLRAEQLAAVGQLAAAVAHEIRNPLTGVKLLLQAASCSKNPTPLTVDRMEILLQEVARIERTVQGLMNFARTPPLHCIESDLRTIVHHAVEATRSRAEIKSITMRVDTPAEPVMGSVDRDQMHSLITNLIVNAIDATQPGGDIQLHLCRHDQQATIEVLDTGPGIAPTVVPRLFTPFTTTKPTGTGLGLTVARRVAQDHQGTLTATNRPSGGAAFVLTLPLVSTHLAPTSEEPHGQTPRH